MAPTYLLIAGLLVGCGATQSANSGDQKSERVAAADPNTIPTTWEELLAVSEAVYFGSWTANTGQDGEREGCLSLERVVYPAQAAAPKRLCAASYPLMNELSWIDGQGEVYAFIELGQNGEAQIAGVANEQSSLLELVRCGLIGRFWGDAPAAHRSCDVDTDCEALSAMCFSDAVAISYAEPYRYVANRFGGGCFGPEDGPCPAESYHAKCVSGQCRAFPDID